MADERVLYNAIQQPPHSAGIPYRGLRSRLDPAQIPSPVEAALHDQARRDHEGPFMTCSGDQTVPLSNTNYQAIDQGNSTPRFVRLTTYAVPSTSDLASACQVPIALIAQPLAKPNAGEDPVPVVNFTEDGPPRCSNCRSYINPWCTWTAAGGRWKCNLCKHVTDVASSYFCSLDETKQRRDHSERPELNYGTVDFVVPKDYWANQPPARLDPSFVSIDPPTPSSPRPPRPMDYVFAIDVSFEAVQSGYVASICTAIQEILYPETGSFFPATSRIAILTFDDTLHFYQLSSRLDQAPMAVVADIDEVFIPIREDLFVDPMQSRQIIEKLLKWIPTSFAANSIAQAALGSAVRAGMAALADRGGQVVVFQSSPPSIGPGALESRPKETESQLYGTDKEKTLFSPRDVGWNSLGEECAEAGIGVHLFLAPSQPIDIGTIGVVASRSGGDISYYPRYLAERDEDGLISDLRRLVSRETGYNCSMRIRCSEGLRVVSHHGNFSQRSPTDLEFGNFDADKSITVLFDHSHSLDERESVYFQVALLYTTPDGERRVRLCNLAVQASGLAGNVFRYGDIDALTTYLAKDATSKVQSKSLQDIRDGLTDEIAGILLAYRRNCAAATSPSQLILPEAYKLLVIYTLAIHKSKPLKGGNVIADVRNFHAHRTMSRGVAATTLSLYPRLTALHDLSDGAGFPDPTTARLVIPSPMRDTYTLMQGHGLYLINNGEVMVLWIGSSISPQILKDLYDEENFHDIKVTGSALPRLQTRLSMQVRNIIAHHEVVTGRKAKFLAARQNMDGSEIEFSNMLVEDQNNGAMTYTDYLCLVHKQINGALTSGSSLGNSGGFKVPW